MSKETITEAMSRRTREAREAREALEAREAREAAERRRVRAAQQEKTTSPAHVPEENPTVIGRKTVEIPVKSALPYLFAGLLWPVFAIFLPLWRIGWLIFTALNSVLLFLILKKTIKNDVRLVEVPVSSGNVEVDEMIRQIHAVTEAMAIDRQKVAAEKPLTAKTMLHIEKTAGKICDVVSASPEDLPKIRKFLNYYLPTTVKLCDKYAFIVGNGGSGTSINETLSSVESALGQLETSYDNLYDSLFDDDALDVTTDVTVLETMLKRDHLE